MTDAAPALLAQPAQTQIRQASSLPQQSLGSDSVASNPMSAVHPNHPHNSWPKARPNTLDGRYHTLRVR